MSSGFISEADVTQRNRVRQEEWEKNRKDDDPLEVPENPETLPDHRSLYDKLQEQRQKKQDDWEEAHKLKNMVRGLEDDEVDFLDLVDRSKLNEEQRVKTEEQTALLEYRKKVAEMQQKSTISESELRETDIKKSLPSTHCGGESKRVSQMSLLAGAIKRKRSPDRCQTSKSQKEDNESSPTKSKDGNLQCIAILPGIGNYTDSSDSDCSNSSDDDSVVHHHTRDLAGRVLKTSGGGQAECC